MTRVEREQMISRYLGGELSTAEEQDFFIRVAVDKELRQDLRAQRTIDSALRKDRDAESTGHTAVRMRVAAMLAATPGTATNAPAESFPRATAGAEGLAGATATSGVAAMKWIATLAAGALVATAVFILPDALTDATDSSNPPSTPSAVSSSRQLPSTSSEASIMHERSDPASASSVQPLPAASRRSTDASATTSVTTRGGTAVRPARVAGVRAHRVERTAPSGPRRSPVTANAIDDVEAPTLDTNTDASALDRRDANRLDDSIDIGIKLRIPKQ